MRLFVLSIVVAGASVAALSAQPAAVTYGRVTVHPETLACADRPLSQPPVTGVRVLGVQDTQRRESFAPGDSLVLSAGHGAGLEPGQRFFLRRAVRGPSRAPISPETPGALRTTGWLTITAVDDQTALGRIDRACDAVFVDDSLEPFALPELPRALPGTGAPQHDAMARVLFGTDRTQAAGAGAILAIDRGAEDGLATGQAFVVYRDTGTGRPLVIIGEAVALAVGPDTSTVVLVRAGYEVMAGDYLAPRAATP